MASNFSFSFTKIDTDVNWCLSPNWKLSSKKRPLYYYCTKQFQLFFVTNKQIQDDSMSKFHQPFCANLASVSLVYYIWHKRCHSVLPTKLVPTLLLHTTRSYTQLLPCTFYAVYQNKQLKSTGSNVAHKMLVKLKIEKIELFRSKIFLRIFFCEKHFYRFSFMRLTVYDRNYCKQLIELGSVVAFQFVLS